MTQEEFIKVLNRKKYPYRIKGDKIIVMASFFSADLSALTSLPPEVVFNNKGGVNLRSLTSLPPDVVFNNGGDVDLFALTSLPPGVVFNNVGGVYLEFLIGVWLYEWEGNIEGIDQKRLLNKMISIGLFDRR